jgi:hypothetical protein
MKNQINRYKKEDVDVNRMDEDKRRKAQWNYEALKRRVRTARDAGMKISVWC